MSTQPVGLSWFTIFLLFPGLSHSSSSTSATTPHPFSNVSSPAPFTITPLSSFTTEPPQPLIFNPRPQFRLFASIPDAPPSPTCAPPLRRKLQELQQQEHLWAEQCGPTTAQWLWVIKVV